MKTCFQLERPTFLLQKRFTSNHFLAVDLELRTVVSDQGEDVLSGLFDDKFSCPFNTEWRRNRQTLRPVEIDLRIDLHVDRRAAPLCIPIIFAEQTAPGLFRASDRMMYHRTKSYRGREQQKKRKRYHGRRLVSD